MIEEYRDHFYCEEHKPSVPADFKSGRNLQPVKCEMHGCLKTAEVVIFPKPLNYPKLGCA